MLEPGTELAGYRIEGVLGQGGMGVVYEATQLSLDRRVALKLLSRELSADPAFRARFEREARLQATIEHPNIVPVHDFGEAGGQLFIAMRIIRGPNLRQVMRTGGLAHERVIALLAPLAAALDAAHAAGLVHRDVKPHNVLVGPSDHPYLADFGLVRGPGTGELTKPGVVLGTVDYMAPEQIAGEAAGPAADVYALAAMAFELLTGRAPFARESDIAALVARVNEPPPAASEMHPGLPPALDAALARGLARDPSGRPATAGELVELIADALRSAPTVVGEPAPAAPGPAPAPPATPPTGPRRGRGRLIAAGAAVLAAGAAAAVLASGGGGGSSSGASGVPIGSDLVGSAEAKGYCNNNRPDRPCTVLNTELSGKSLEFPSDGRVTGIEVKQFGGTVTLVIVEGSPLRRRVVATGPTLKPSGGGVEDFEADVQVKAGQLAAWEVAADGFIGYRYLNDATAGETYDPPLTGEPAEGTATQGYEILARVRFEPE